MVSAKRQHELAIGTQVSLPLKSPAPSHPSRLSQSTDFGFPTSYSKFPLAICFNVVMYMFQCSSLKSFHPQKCISNYFWWGGLTDDGPSLHLSTCLSLD